MSNFCRYVYIYIRIKKERKKKKKKEKENSPICSSLDGLDARDHSDHRFRLAVSIARRFRPRDLKNVHKCILILEGRRDYLIPTEKKKRIVSRRFQKQPISVQRTCGGDAYAKAEPPLSRIRIIVVQLLRLSLRLASFPSEDAREGGRVTDSNGLGPRKAQRCDRNHRERKREIDKDRRKRPSRLTLTPSTSCTNSKTIASRDGAGVSAIVSASPWWWSDGWSPPSSAAGVAAFVYSRSRSRC